MGYRGLSWSECTLRLNAFTVSSVKKTRKVLKNMVYFILGFSVCFNIFTIYKNYKEKEKQEIEKNLKDKKMWSDFYG